MSKGKIGPGQEPWYQAPIPDEELRRTSETAIRIRCNSVQYNQETGIASVFVKVQPISETYAKMITDLFPNLADKVYPLLQIETLISSLVQD